MIASMRGEKASCAVAVDGSGRPLGIVTEQDIARRVAFAVDPETPVEKVMTRPITTIHHREYLYQAIAWMRRSRLAHLPVVDDEGALAGMLYLTDALSAASDRTLNRIDRLSHEGSLEGLAEVKKAQVELAEELFADNLRGPEVQAFLTRVNNDIYRRVLDACVRDLAAGGWGEPPKSACAIVMGSGGRGENFLFPDQDNGFIIADYPDEEHNSVDAYFTELAVRMSHDLDVVGIPYCNGFCMAVNPLWRKTLSQWIEQVRQWGRKGGVVAVRLADIFFDFQPVWGDEALAQTLRAHVTETVRANHFFLSRMYNEEADHNVALGFFGGLATEKDDEEHRGQVNLKHAGAIPLVESVRLLALREGIEATSTLDRIEALRVQGVLDERESDDLVIAFRGLTYRLLRQQIDDFKADRKVSYFVDPGPLSKRDRDRMVQSLKAVDALRKRVRSEFTAEIF